MINFHFIKKDFKLNQRRKIKNWLADVIIREHKRPGQIDIIFCSDDYLLDLNKKHLNHNYFTDIITFNYSDDKNNISGDLFISTERVKENAYFFKVKDDLEMHRVMLHGILHLIGYNDEEPDEIILMRSKEQNYLQDINWI